MSEQSLKPDGRVDEPEHEASEAEDNKPKEKKAKAKQPKEKKAKDKGKKSADATSGGLSVATHPRAGAYVRRAKGWGGLAGFAIAAYLSFQAGAPPDQVGLRALAAGVAGYMLAWACTLTVWRHLVLAELRALAERRDPANSAGGTGAAAGGADDSPTPTPSR